MSETGENQYAFPELDLEKLPALDVVVIHGGNIRQDTKGEWHSTSWVEGTEKSRGAFSRIIAASMLYHEGKTKKIIVSTGRTVPSPDNPLKPDPNAPTEAAVMKKELRELGVPDEDIVEEDTSENTWRNAANSADIVRRHEYTKVGILTSDWHLPRTRMFWDDQQLQKEGRALFNLPAEAIVGRDSPGYQKLITTLYNSPRMQQKIADEQKGMRDFKSGKYNPRPPH